MRIFDIPNTELDNTRKMFGDLEKDKRNSDSPDDIYPLW